MSRVTSPVTKFVHQFQAIRRISSSAATAHPSVILDSSARSSIYLPRKLSELKEECSKRRVNTTGSKAELISRLSAQDTIRAHSTTNGHRPTPSITRTIPLMQGFRTSAPRSAPHDPSTVDHFVFPSLSSLSSNPNSVPKLRVPLLPDNYSPDRSSSSFHTQEVMDTALPRPEINIVAAHPEEVLGASALTEVVGNEGMGDVDLGVGVWVREKGVEVKEGIKETMEVKGGVIRDLWKGIVEDFVGPRGGTAL